MKILVVDDEASLRAILDQVLSDEGYDVVTASSGEGALEMFSKDTFSVVITDIKMPGMSGIDLLKEIKDIDSDTQVIIMTSHASVDSAVNAIRLGAYDYLIKPFEDLDIIAAVANRAIERTRLIEENRELVEKLRGKNEDLEQANKKLKQLAIRDGLTGIYNHRYFQEALMMELIRAKRYERGFSLIFFDIDHFKHYNDTNGHPQGDILLRELAQNLSDRLRESDIIARYGGEEFVIIMPETTKDIACNVAEGIRKYVETYPYEGRDKQPEGKVTISMGVSSFPEDGDNGTSLIQAADKALYEAKSGGRNQVCRS
ncbi:MAG: diguanylate cyclase [Nitrospirota bacterium]|nr:MAG: diguanylate cyclase [Nitrospirota bacterium]